MFHVKHFVRNKEKNEQNKDKRRYKKEDAGLDS